MPFRWNPFTGNLDVVEDLQSLNEVAQRLEVTLIADENISALQAVRQVSDTNCAVADATTFERANAIGIALNSASTGGSVTVQLLGALSDPFFTFGANTPIYISDVTPGLVTDVAPTSGFVTVLGQGLGSGSIFINLKEPIEL